MSRYVSGSLETQWVEGAQPFFSLQINRRGTLMLRDFRMAVDGGLQSLGQIPLSSAAAVAPELPRIYTFDDNGTIRTFDTSQPAVGGALVEVTPAITLVAAPGVPSRVEQMIVSPDGRTAFIAGRDRIIVQPLP